MNADVVPGVQSDLCFDWDSEKGAKTRRERGFGFDYAVRIFAGPAVQALDRRHDHGEERIKAIGEIEGRTDVVVYTDRPVARWIISAWKASGKDRRTWLNKR